MKSFIEEFYYGNIEPQGRSRKQSPAVKKEFDLLTKNEELLTQALTDEVCDFMTNDKVHKHDIFKCPQCTDGYMIVKMNPKNGNVFYGCTNYFSDVNKCTNMITLTNEPV